MSQSYDTQGTIHSIGQTTEYGQNGFTKREFVILLSGEGENPDFKNYVQFTVMKDKCALLDQFQTGNELKVTFNLGGRLWEGNGNGEKCFVDLQAWKLELLNIGQQAPSPQPNAYQQQPPQQQPPQQAPQAAPRSIEDVVAEFSRSGQIQRDEMWPKYSDAERAAISAAFA